MRRNFEYVCAETQTYKRWWQRYFEKHDKAFRFREFLNKKRNMILGDNFASLPHLAVQTIVYCSPRKSHDCSLALWSLYVVRSMVSSWLRLAKMWHLRPTKMWSELPPWTPFFFFGFSAFMFEFSGSSCTNFFRKCQTSCFLSFESFGDRAIPRLRHLLVFCFHQLKSMGFWS